MKICHEWSSAYSSRPEQCSSFSGLSFSGFWLYACTESKQKPSPATSGQKGSSINHGALCLFYVLTKSGPILLPWPYLSTLFRLLFLALPVRGGKTEATRRNRIIRNVWFRALSSRSLKCSSPKVRRLPPGPLDGRSHDPASLV